MLVYSILAGLLILGFGLAVGLQKLGFAVAGVLMCLSGIFLWKFYFLRNPNRKIPEQRNAIVSPADGKIIEIMEFSMGQKPWIKKGRFGKIISNIEKVSVQGYIVSIFMSLFDVHVNRAPIAGEVIFQKHTTGRFHPANHPLALIENEKNEIIIQGESFRVGVIQIGGLIARRIETFVSVNTKLSKGQCIGIINLGSQVSLVLPKGLKLCVKEGDKVKAGSSIIAEE